MFTTSLFVLVAVMSCGLGAVAVARPPRTLRRWSFALGMAGFTTEALAGFALVTWSETPEDHVFWLKATFIAGLLLLVPWGFFVVSLVRPSKTRLSRRLWLGLGAGAVVAVGSAVTVALLPTFEVADFAATFYAARIRSEGRIAVVVQLLATVGFLAGCEAALRIAKRAARQRIKFLVLGFGGVFLVRFYFLSQIVLFNVVMANYLVAEAATLIVGEMVIAAALMRDRLGVELTVSRQVLYRSVVAGTLGLYLLAVGVLGWLLNQLGIAEELFLGSLVVFVSAVALASVLLSEKVRWWFKGFVARNFYRTKYDYREQWGNFTKRLSSLVTLDELAPELLAAVLETVGATDGVLYLLDDDDTRYRAVCAVGVGCPRAPVSPDQSLVVSLTTAQKPLAIDSADVSQWMEPAFARAFTEGSTIVPLRWSDKLTGFLVIGPERTGVPYTIEDLEFMETVTEQAAGAIITARLSERLVQSHEFEAFHRLTSFVIHDLKNSISALAMLSDNALGNFADPEFQRDTIKTVSKTVDRMKALLARLAAAPDSDALRLEPVDLAALALEAARPVVKNERISLVKDLAPLPISADPDALLKVIQNLIANALQSIEGEGTVRLRTFERDGWAVLSVSDTGCGMSDEFIRRSLFAPFRSTKKGGWGIGLYQTKGIVEAHGGSIEVSSREGAGTSFTIKLPRGNRGR